MDVFEGLLVELNTNSEDSFKVDAIIRKISNYFKKDEADCSIDLLIFLVFGENGLIEFTTKNLSSEANRSSVLRAFSLLEYILANYEKICLPYAEKVKKSCLAIAQSTVAAKIRENVLKLFKCVLTPAYITSLDLSKIMGIINRLKDEAPPSVQAQLFSVAGLIFEKMPELVQNGNDFLNFFLSKIREDRMSKVSVVSGCLDGINGYLVNFSPDAEQVSDLYAYLKDFCSVRPRRRDFTQRETRKAAERSALKIVHRHYRVFARHIHTDIRFWHENLNFWLERGKEDRHLSFNALVAVYKSVAYFCNSPQGGVAPGNLENVVNELLNRQPGLNTASIIGLVELISTGNVREDLANRILQLVTKRFRAKSDNLMYLSLNLECISKYLGTANIVKADYLIQIKRMAVALIDNYPKTEPNFRKFSLEALEKSFYNVERCGSHELDEYIKEVIYQGLIRSCSYQVYTYTEMKKEVTGKEQISHKSFLPLWTHITNLGSSTTELEHSGSKNAISSKVLDEYFSSFLKLNKKLDLRFQVKDPYIPDAETTAEAVRPNDWLIFINNVNLFVDIVEGIDDLHRMKKWMMTILSDAIDSANRAPQISEYYKIIIACLKVAEKIQFFDSNKVNEAAIQKFLWSVSQRAGQYKGDAQVSCFQILLAAPLRLVEPFMKDLVPVFKMILQVSTGNFLLLEECVSALEKWFTSSPNEDLEFLLKSILPYFDVFLQSKSESQSVPHVYHIYASRNSLKPSGEMKNVFGKNADSKLFRIQKKFLLFLGNLSTDITKHLMEDKAEEGDSEGDDDDDDEDWVKSLTYDLPLTDGNLRICINFLPRVIELALSSGDRYTRIRACEFLHTAVALTLGNMKKMNGELTGLFRKLVPICLQLASDSDSKVQQIYELLVIQMVHYFAGRDRNVSESEIFIDCLMKSVSHPSNSKLRDLAAKLIREFVEWSLQDVTSTGEICYDVKLIMRSMYSLAVHPNYYKRRGSAIVFNTIYSLLNDETDLLDTNWFMFYYYFIEGLSMCALHEDTSHVTNAVELIKTSLRGKDLDTNPKVPPGFNENYKGTPIAWIFSRCSHNNAKIRKLSMSIIEDFSKGSVKEFIKAHVSEVLKKDNIIKDQGKGNDITWLSTCSSLFDYYNWLLANDTVTGDDLRSVGIQELLVLFTKKMTARFEISDSTRFQALNSLHLLELLTTATDRNIIFHNLRILDFLKVCIYNPSQCKFEVSDLEAREKLVSGLKVLLTKLVPVLRDYEIMHLIKADEYYFCALRLGTCLQNRESLWEMTEMLNGLKLVHGLGLWNTRVKQNITGNEILRLVFNSIFVQRPRRCSAFLIDVHDKIFLADFIKFGIEIGVSVDAIIDILKNKEEIIEEETFVKSTKGEYFMNMFKDELFDYFIRNSEVAMDEIILQFPNSALITIFNTLNHSNRTNLSFGYKKRFVSELSQRWTRLEELPDSSQILLLSITRSMCQMVPDALVEECAVRDWFLNVMATTKVLEELEIIFDMFPYVSCINEDFNEGLSNTLDQMFRNLRFFSGYYDAPDTKVVIACKGLLNSFVRTKSVTVLQAVTRILKKYRTLWKEDEIEKIAAHVCQSKVNKISEDHLTIVLSSLYEMLFNIDGSSDEVYECFFLKLLQKSSSDFAWNYLLDILDDLMGILRGDNLVQKISALKIIQSCVARAKRYEMDSVSDQKEAAFRSCIGICSKIPLVEETELLRKYVCCCFNTLCAIISVKSSEQRLYKGLIFRDNFPFVGRMVCQNRKWVLKMDFDEIPKRRKVLISLRKYITKERQMKSGKTVSSVQYLEGDTLYESSLKDDVTRFDYPNWIVGPLEPTPKREVGEQYLELEMDQINKHECMPTLIGLVKYMVEDGITPVDRRSPPFWLSALMARMTSLHCAENEKIFVMKVLTNIGEYIKPYAEFIVADILQTMLLVFHEESINYLIVDMVSMILSWSLDWNAFTGEVQTSLTQMAIFIIQKSVGYRRDVIKYNLEVTKLIVETCKDILKLNVLSMYGFKALEAGVSAPAETKHVVNYLNLQFCSILLANSIPAWDDNQEEDFMNLILEYFVDEVNGKIAAEVCGLALKYLQSHNFRNMEHIIKLAKRKVQQVKKSHTTKELSLIYGVYKNFPEFSLHFVGVIRNSAWGLRGQFRVQSLEMLLTYLKSVSYTKQSVFGSTIYGFLLDMLSPDDFEALSISLQIAEIFLDKPVDGLAGDVFEKALSFGDYKIARVRKSVYNIAAALLENWEERYMNKLPERIKRMCKIVLLNGMNDKESDLSERCLEFWYMRTSESESSTQFGKILCEVYCPEAEKGFFNFAAKLMIRSSVYGIEFGKSIFEHPLVFGSTFQNKIISSTTYFSTPAPSFSINLSGSLDPSKLFELENEDGSQGEGAKSDASNMRTRFLKDSRKFHKYFGKKKTALEEELERQKAMSDDDVDLVREYKDGDYPFIQITHSDILKPLQELTMQDPQIGRYFITTLYDGFAVNITDDVKEMIIQIGELVEQVFEENPSSDPAIAAFLFHVHMNCDRILKADSDAVAKVAKLSGWPSVGGLVIEDLIIAEEVEPPVVRRKGVSKEEKAWFNLAELTRCSKEFEILRGILVDKLSVGANTCEAIRCESVSDWFNASASYESALNEGETLLDDFCVNAYLNSLARLSDWTKLSSYVRDTYDLGDLWTNSSLFERVLPWYMKCLVYHSEIDNSVIELATIQQDSEKENDLKKYFVEELASFHFMDDKYQWAEYYLHLMCANFLSNWSHWNKWANNYKFTKLTDFQLMSETDRCVKVFKEKTNVEISKLANLWSRNRPRESDDLLMWDLKFVLRNYFLYRLRSSHKELDWGKIRKSVLASQFDFVRSGIAQKNVTVCEKYLEEMRGDVGMRSDYEMWLMLNYYTSSCELLKAEEYEKDENIRLTRIVDASSGLQRQMKDMMDSRDSRTKLFFYECNMELGRVMSLLQSYNEESLGYAAIELDIGRYNIKKNIQEKELEYLQNAVKVAEGMNLKLLSDAYVRIVKYHKRQEGYNSQLAKFLFRSMSLGNTEARQLFCCLLNEVRLAEDWVSDGEIKTTFETVPVWMFLKWINQMFANLDSEMFPFLKDVLSSLAGTYPNSMRYAFELSKTNFKYSHKYGDECRKFVATLTEKLFSGTHHHNFLSALSFVASPDLVLKYVIKKVATEVKLSTPDWDKIIGMVQDFYQRVYGEELKRFRGPVYDCLTKVKPDIEALLNMEHESSLWQDKILNLVKSMPKCNLDDTLKQFSPWLYNFQATNHDSRIELPGQYSGDHKPILKNQVFISSFKYRVLVMNSKCKPVRISILGDNGREYKFLVKFGEDVRQDQRIQQVFDQMNHVLRGSGKALPHFIDTYKVIPLKCDLGIIEWVNNTISLHEMLTEQNPSIKKTLEMVQKLHLEFLAQDTNVTNVTAAYLNGFKKINRNNSIARFTERVYSFEWDLLRKAFWNMSMYPEQFIYLRKNFASSEAVIFIAHWLIGIGDRHLDNTLVSTKTGRALGIDFGCAFGFATEFLTPPELVPFRLTPQIVNLMKPLGTSGLIKEIMIHCLKAFRREKSSLLAMLEVFASEPALDWLEKAKRDGTFKDDSGWSPRKKIAMVKEKLEGANPVKIFSDDLKSGHSNSDCLEKYLEVLRGDGSRGDEAILTEEKQVDVLIDLASDYHILSKTYVGWNPWL